MLWNKERNKSDKCHRYNLKKWNERATFDSFNNISNHATLSQFMDTVGNVNNAVIIDGFCIYD